MSLSPNMLAEASKPLLSVKPPVESQPPRPSQPEDLRIPATKRGRYVSRACSDCKKRKVKCSGEQPCQQCFNADVECMYSVGRPKKRRAAHSVQSQGEAGSNAVTDGSATSSASAIEAACTITPETSRMQMETDPLAGWKADIMLRIGKLEQNSQQWQASRLTPSSRTSTPTSATEHEPSTPRSLNSRSLAISTARNYGLGQTESTFQGGTNLRYPMEALESIVGQHNIQDDFPRSVFKMHQRCSLLECSDFPECCQAELHMWNAKSRPREVQYLLATVRDFFDYLNPHYPGLNEPQFFLELERYLASGDNMPQSVHSLQFVALVNLIIALMKVLDEYCTDSKTTPGTVEFSRAEHLLSHAASLGQGNLMTIQCAIVKATYLLYAEKQNAAYDTIGAAVRLCFQIGLHDQLQWQNLSLFEISIRQRVFWSVYCLDRNVAMVCGAPYILRHSDFRVEEPLSFDDKHLLPEIRHLQETPECSPIPYLRATAKWARLYTEIWDATFGMSAVQPISQEFVAIMDARIVLLSDELPPHLQFRHDAANSDQSFPPYIQRQSMIFYLRINHLRLLLRRQEMLSSTCQTRTAITCVKIAANSVTAIYTQHTSPQRRSIERYSSVLYIAGALIPLICVVVNEAYTDEVKTVAMEFFQNAYTVLQDIAPGLTFARRILQQLRRSIMAVNKAILARWPQDLGSSAQDRDQSTTICKSYVTNMFSEPENVIALGGDMSHNMHSISFLENLMHIPNVDHFQLQSMDPLDMSLWGSEIDMAKSPQPAAF